MLSAVYWGAEVLPYPSPTDHLMPLLCCWFLHEGTYIHSFALCDPSGFLD